MVKTTDSSIDLEGLDRGVFRELFLACVFGEEQSGKGHDDLLEIGEMIVEKLKGSPLAAKTVGRLLRNHFDQHHWIRVLESREWEMETSNHDIMPALQLSYDYLPFYLQQCFSYCALFPEDHKFDSKELTRFWIGLDILHSECHNKTFEDIALSNLEGLVSHGFFKKDETDDGQTCYIIHDLLHNLAVKVASHECVSLHCSNVRSLEIRPSIRHLSIIIDGVDDSGGITVENFRSELIKLKTRLKVENLQTLLIFGEIDANFIGCLGDLFKEANALRVLHLPEMSFPVESILYRFPTLLHLRYIMMGTPHGRETHLKSVVSRFCRLRILDLGEWSGYLNFPRDFSNLSKLRYFLTKNDEPHSAISNVQKLQSLQELKRFEVHEESEGFELKQLGYLTELRRLGIYNLERIQTKEATAEAKLLNKNALQKLELSWDKCQNRRNPDKEDEVLESLRPCNSLRELSIYGHGGSTCPTWLGEEISTKFLETLHLSHVAWKIFPPLGEMCLVNELNEEPFGCITGQTFRNLKRLELIGLPKLRKWAAKEVCPMFFSLMEVLIVKDCNELVELPFSYYNYCPSEGDGEVTWFPRLRAVEIYNCPKLVSLPPIPYIQTLCSVDISNVGTSLESLVYSSGSSSLTITRNTNLNGLDDNVLAFHNLTQLQELEINYCPPLAESHLQMLKSLKKLELNGSSVTFNPFESRSGIKSQLSIEHLRIWHWCASGKALTQLLSCLPKLSNLHLYECHKIRWLCVAVEQQQTTVVSLNDTQAIESNQQQQQTKDLMDEEKVVPQLTVDQEDEDGLVLLPAHLLNSLRKLDTCYCPELILVAPPLSTRHQEETGAWGLQTLGSLQVLEIKYCPKFLLAYKASGCPFPSSPKQVRIAGHMEGVQRVDLSNFTSLTQLHIDNSTSWQTSSFLNFGEGMWRLLTKGQLGFLIVLRSPGFLAGLDPICWGLQDEQEHQHLLLQRSSKLETLWTDDFMGVLVKPICSLFSSSLINLSLQSNDDEVEHFTKEQEEALQLLTSLQDLRFKHYKKLQFLPAGLYRLTNLKSLVIMFCPSIQSLPNVDLPSSLQILDVSYCSNEKLKHRCMKLKGTIPTVII